MADDAKVTRGTETPPVSALPLRGLVALGGVQLLLLAGSAAAGVQGGLPMPALPLLLAAFLVSLLAAGVLPGRGADPSASRIALPWIWGFAVLYRVVLLPLDPLLSDDVWRYLWDGVVQQGGINPFLHPPSAPELEALRTPWHPLINNPDVPTIYPGAAQLVFRFVAWAGGGLLLLKGVLVAAELGAAALLYGVARRLGRAPARVLVLVLWSPLAVVETAWSGHVDALGLLFLCMALAAATREPGRNGGAPVRAALAGVALALAAMVKVAPAAALPPFLRRPGWPAGLGFGVAGLLVMIPYLDAGPRLLTGLFTYAEHWRFNEALFGVLEWVVPGPLGARFAAGILVLGVVGWVTWRRMPPDRALFWILGTGLLLSPTLHPWYLLWILPLAALRGSRGWLLATGTILLAYWGLGTYQRTGIWPHPDGLRLLVWGPPLALLLVDGIRGNRTPVPESLEEAHHAAPHPTHGKEGQEGD